VEEEGGREERERKIAIFSSCKLDTGDVGQW
jgi:hypothetical protein